MDLPGLLSTLRRRWLPVALCIVAGVVGSGLLSASSPKTYRSTARLFVNIPAARDVQQALQGVQLSSQLIDSYARIATSRAVAERVSTALEGQFSAGEVRSRVRATPEADTLLLDISATDVDPQSAADLANATATVLTQVVAELEQGKAGSIEARVIDPAVSSSNPISPRTGVDLTIGLLLGLAAGALAVFVLEATDKSVTSGAEAAEALGRPALATVPRHRHLDSEPLVALEGAGSPGAEAYRALRTAVRFIDVGRPVRTLLVTSPGAGEGKSTTASNLAVAFAQSGERVLLIDADLRRGRLAPIFGAAGSPGLTDVIAGRMDVGAANQAWRDQLELLAPGPLPANPSELLGSQVMADLLEELGRTYDIVILDAPPLLPVTDAVVLAALVDAVVVVAQWAKTTDEVLEDSRLALDSVGASVLGVVLNGERRSRSRRYYRTYHSQADQRTAIRAAS